MYKCKICNECGIKESYIVREMMFGFGDTFTYFRCSNCDCLQIDKIPLNLEKYYPDNYYSFHSDLPVTKIKELLDSFGDKKTFGAFVSEKFDRSDFEFLLNVDTNCRILDVGCGRGTLLLSLKEVGFFNLTGVDPFITNDIFYENGVTILKRKIFEIYETYDVIMLHHSFEHMAEPLPLFRKLHSLIDTNGTIIIRIPIFPSFAWRKYGVNWVQLDAPRHFFLHSVKSIRYLAGKVGLEVKSIHYDSNTFQFIGSELYQKNLSLMKYINKNIFSEDEKSTFAETAKELNKKNDGDQACIYLIKK
jgi:SAM-dependent methyltransferase